MIEIDTIKSEIVERLKVFNPDKIILFGSYAYGTPRESSDIDLFLLMHEKKENLEAKALFSLRDLMKKYKIGFDVLAGEKNLFLKETILFIVLILCRKVKFFMANKTYALEWMQKSLHDLSGARLLYESDHYTDTTSYVWHQSLEKMLKAISAYCNEPQRKTHNLVELYELLAIDLDLGDDEVFMLSIATTYQTKQRYPVTQKILPSKKEIGDILDFTEKLFSQISDKLQIDPENIC